MTEIIKHTMKKIREGMLLDMWRQTKWIYQYARRYWKAMIFYTVLGLAGTLVSLGSSLISKNLVDIITGHQTGALLKTFCLMIGFGVGSSFMNQICSYASSWISMKVDTEIKADVFAKMLVTDLESIADYHTGDLMTRWSSDASAISSGVLNFIPNLIISLFKFISAFVIVIYHDASFALFAMLGVPFSVAASRTLMKRMANNNKRSAAMNAKMSGFNQESFSNLRTIKAFDMISLYIERLKQFQTEYIFMKMDFQKMSMATSLLMSMVGLLVSYSSYGWGIYRVWSGAISYGTMTLFLSMSGTLTGALNNLISLVPTSISLTTSAGRLMDILNMPQEDYSNDQHSEAFLAQYREEGFSLSFRHLDYAYKNGARILEDATFLAHPHEIVALVGPSGEGKTTMLHLMLALLRPACGEALLSPGMGDSKEFLQISPSTRKFFSYVPQGNTMFSGTIAENMRNVKPDATDEEIVEALRMACAWDFVAKLPDGIHSYIRERGGGFSEGQAQRLSIARALLRHSPILLLDEATSALDIQVEKRILQNIAGDTYPRTCIVTTHRTSVLDICDSVYVIRGRHCEKLEAPLKSASEIE